MNESTAVVLDFEKDILEIEEKIEHLKLLAKDEDMDITREIRRLERKLSQHVNRTYMKSFSLAESADSQTSCKTALFGLYKGFC